MLAVSYCSVKLTTALVPLVVPWDPRAIRAAGIEVACSEVPTAPVPMSAPVRLLSRASDEPTAPVAMSALVRVLGKTFDVLTEFTPRSAFWISPSMTSTVLIVLAPLGWVA